MTNSPILLTHTLSHTDTSAHMPRSMTSPAAPLTINEPEERRADVNPWVCMILLVITVGFTGATAEFVSLLHTPLRVNNVKLTLGFPSSFRALKWSSIQLIYQTSPLSLPPHLFYVVSLTCNLCGQVVRSDPPSKHILLCRRFRRHCELPICAHPPPLSEGPQAQVTAVP